MEKNVEKISQLKKKIEILEKTKLIDTISAYAYFYASLERSKYTISTVELEFLMNLIYEIDTKEEKRPSTEEIQEILKLTKEIIEEEQKVDDLETPIHTLYAKSDFLYCKEDNLKIKFSKMKPK